MLNEPAVALFPGSLKLPATAVGSTSKTFNITFSNPGTTSVAIRSIKVTGAEASDFAETNNCGKTLATGKSCVVAVDFHPTEKGNRGCDPVQSATVHFAEFRPSLWREWVNRHTIRRELGSIHFGPRVEDGICGEGARAYLLRPNEQQVPPLAVAGAPGCGGMTGIVRGVGRTP